MTTGTTILFIIAILLIPFAPFFGFLIFMIIIGLTCGIKQAEEDRKNRETNGYNDRLYAKKNKK